MSKTTCPDCGGAKSPLADRCRECHLLAKKKQVCLVPECDRYPNGGHGMCSMHYRRWLKRGDTTRVRQYREPFCSVDGCERPHHANGLCSMHEQRRRAGLDLAAPRLRAPKGAKPQCWAEGCSAPASAKGLCPMHYQRWRKHGDPLVRTRRLPEGSEQWTKRDKTLFYKFGITPSEFEAMLDEQERKCLGCGTQKPNGKGWHVDHCHATGVVRRVLCPNCNTILGLAYESGDVLRALAVIADADRESREALARRP